jgi:hypothetical protein
LIAGDNNYRVNTSRYTNEKSTRIGQVNSKNNPFADSVDQTAIAQSEERYASIIAVNNLISQLKIIGGMPRRLKRPS